MRWTVRAVATRSRVAAIAGAGRGWSSHCPIRAASRIRAGVSTVRGRGSIKAVPDASPKTKRAATTIAAPVPIAAATTILPTAAAAPSPAKARAASASVAGCRMARAKCISKSSVAGAVPVWRERGLRRSLDLGQRRLPRAFPHRVTPLARLAMASRAGRTIRPECSPRLRFRAHSRIVRVAVRWSRRAGL